MGEEKKNVVTASAEDVNHIRAFVKHFNLLMTPDLDAALNGFEKNPTYENQVAVRRAIATFVVTEPSGLLKDKMFAPLYNESDKIQYYSSFEENLNELLVDEEKKD